MYYLYHLINTRNKIKYVGVTVNPRKRENNHRRSKPKHKFIIVKSFNNIKEATKSEIEDIKLYNTKLKGWNKTTGGEYEHCSGYSRKGIGGAPKGRKSWNHGIKDCFSAETIQRFKNVRKGICWRKRKVSLEQIKEIGILYESNPILENVGKIQKNGRKLSYDYAFSLHFASQFGVTPQNISRILKLKLWINPTKDTK